AACIASLGMEALAPGCDGDFRQPTARIFALQSARIRVNTKCHFFHQGPDRWIVPQVPVLPARTDGNAMGCHGKVVWQAELGIALGADLALVRVGGKREAERLY